MNHFIRRHLGIASLCLMLSVALLNCHEDMKASTSQPPTVRTAQVTLSDSAQDLVLSGALEADVSVAVSFHTPLGTVQKVLVNEGQQVQQEQVLATLDPGSLQDQLAEAEAKMHQAEDAWNRLEPMHKNGTIPEIKWVETETDRTQARSVASQARRALGDATLHAPISGIIAKRSIEPGEQVPVGISAFTIVQTETMLAVIQVAEKDIVRLKLGTQARITVDAVKQEIVGKVREIGIEADPFSRTYKVKIALANPSRILRVGMVAKVRLHVTNAPTLVVPNAAVLVDENDRRFVWVMKDNSVQRHFVRITGFLQEGLAVDSGLSAGQTVIISGTPMLSEGLHVQVGR